MHGDHGTAAALGALQDIPSEPTVRTEDAAAAADRLGWARREVALCVALVQQGKNAGEIGPLVAAALRACDMLSHHELPVEMRAQLQASAREALRALAGTDGRQRRRATSAP